MSAGCLLRLFLSFDLPLFVEQRYSPQRKDEARERVAPCRRREDWRPGARRTEFRECESVGRHASGAEKARERKERRGEESRGKGCRHLHSNEARRECDGNHGSRGFLSRADLSVPLSGLSSSSFSSSGPLPSAHGAGKRSRGRRSSLEPIRKEKVGRTWARAALWRKGFFLFSSFLPSFRAASRQFFFPRSGASSQFRSVWKVLDSGEGNAKFRLIWRAVRFRFVSKSKA